MTNILQYLSREKNTCVTLPKKVSEYLQVDKFLSEYDTDEEKELVMLNLLLLDNTPTEGSTKLINSGDLYNVLRHLLERVDANIQELLDLLNDLLRSAIAETENNINISEVNRKITELYTLVDEGSVEAIDKVNEIKEFLSGFNESDKLIDIIDLLNESISNRYLKPETGIPNTDLSQEVQNSLDLANTALQKITITTDGDSILGDSNSFKLKSGLGIQIDKTENIDGAILSIDNDVIPTKELIKVVTDINIGEQVYIESLRAIAAEQQIINTKLDNIVDLATIRSGAAAGATAQQPATTLDGYGITDAYTKDEVDSAIESVDASADIAAEVQRATSAELANANAIDSEVSRATIKENLINSRVDDIEDALETKADAATTLAGYGIVDGYTKTEGLALENTVDNRLDALDAAIELLNGSEVIVVDDHTAVTTPDSQKIYREQGTTSYTDWMYQNNTWKEIATYDFPGVDNVPTFNSENLVKSGGVYDTFVKSGIYDVSANNDGAVFASLQALLNNANLNTLIPAPFRRGGITIKFIQGTAQSSDNRYVQYRLMAQNFSAIESDWQGVDDEPTAGSENLIKSGGVHDAIASKVPLVDEDGFHVIDEDLNVGMKYGEDGLDVAKVSSHFIEVLKAAGISSDDVMASHAAEVNEDGFFIADESLNVGAKVDSDGFHAKNILEYEIINI